MHKINLAWLTVLIACAAILAPALAEAQMSTDREFLQYMGYVLYPDELLHDYPAYSAEEKCDPESLDLVKVASKRSWSVANLDRKSGKLFLDVIKRNEEYWTREDDPEQVPIYLDAAPERCCNRVFVFVNSRDASHEEIMKAFAALQEKVDQLGRDLGGRIDDSAAGLADALEEFEPSSWPFWLALAALAIVLLLAYLFAAWIAGWRPFRRQAQRQEQTLQRQEGVTDRLENVAGRFEAAVEDAVEAGELEEEAPAPEDEGDDNNDRA